MGELEDTRREILWHFMGHNVAMVFQLMEAMYLDYQSLTIVILVSTFGLLLVVVVKDLVIFIIVLVLSMEDTVLLSLFTMITTVNQVQCIVLIIQRISSMTHYGMGKDVWTFVVMTPLNLGSIVS